MKVIFRNSKIYYQAAAPFVPITINAVSSHNILNVPLTEVETESSLQKDTVHRCKLYKNGVQYTEPIQQYNRNNAYVPNSGGGAQSVNIMYPIDGIYTIKGYNSETAWKSIGESTSPSTREVDTLVTVKNNGFIPTNNAESSLFMTITVSVTEDIDKGILTRGKEYKFRLFCKGEELNKVVPFYSRNSNFVVGQGGGLISQENITPVNGVYTYTIDPNENTVWLQIGFTPNEKVDTIQVL